MKVKVVNKEDGWVNFWSLDKFEERLEIMWENLQYYFIGKANEQNTEDPFWDPEELC